MISPMNQANIQPKIDSFWKWFVQMEDRIATFFSEESDVDKETLIEAINNRVLDFGLFAWEISAGTNKRFRLVLSPNGDAQRLALSQSIVAQAPSLRDWEFYYAKPAKQWDYVFSIYDDFMMERSIEAFRWEYVLLEYPDDTLEIKIMASNIQFLDKEAQKAAVDLALTNIVGEEAKVNYLNQVSIVAEFEEEYNNISTPIRDFKEHFDEILAEWTEQE